LPWFSARHRVLPRPVHNVTSDADKNSAKAAGRLNDKPLKRLPARGPVGDAPAYHVCPKDLAKPPRVYLRERLAPMPVDAGTKEWPENGGTRSGTRATMRR
jgi:hypothetical protein